jgi:hypothetical protein
MFFIVRTYGATEQKEQTRLNGGLRHANHQSWISQQGHPNAFARYEDTVRRPLQWRYPALPSRGVCPLLFNKFLIPMVDPTGTEQSVRPLGFRLDLAGPRRMLYVHPKHRKPHS